MLNQSSTSRRVLPRATFKQLQNLWQRMTKLVEAGAIVLTEDVLSSVEISPKRRGECFTVLVSPQFSALLTAQEHSPCVPGSLEVGLTFAPEAIAVFLNQLTSWLGQNSPALGTLNQARLMLQPNDPTIQSKFTLSLVEILSLEGYHDESEPAYAYVSVCQPVEDALRQQVEQERLLNQVTTQIRQSLDLPVILETAVEQVRYFLQVDRLAIYQFEEKGKEEAREHRSIGVQEQLDTQHSSPNRGRVTYEARALDNIPSVLNLAQEEQCFFVNALRFREKYSKGFTQAVADIETADIFSPYCLDFLRRIQVRAKLIAPIVVQDELWGLLIAHQCFEPRQWLDSEKNFLGHIAEHLAIAIDQAQLYAQLQQQKQTLEQRVIERTQALHDALLAAQSASLAKSEFLATMSHELRTPLTCVIGLSATLLRSSDGQRENEQRLPVNKQRDYLRTIHDNGQRLLELINDILDLSQVEAGKAVLNISEFSLARLAKQTLQMFAEKACINGVKLELNLKPVRERVSLERTSEPSEVAHFRADQYRVRQILFNLLSNAIKFTPKGGRVTLRVWQEENTAILQVKDTGIGIAEDQLPLLFQKFQQLESSYNRTYEGTGLGLALTKQLVELHGGSIEVESTPGAGSTFTVWLPAQPIIKDEGSRMKGETEDSSFRKGSIVLVEDDEEVATPICDILTAAGYQMVWLIDGFTAVGKIELLQPIAVIVGMRSPKIDGCDISKPLRNSPATQHIKILVLTEIEMPEDIEICLAAGADDYLPKPVQLEQLLHKVEALVRTSKASS